MSRDFVQHVVCETADELLDAISPRGPFLRRYAALRQPRDVIFRGHADDRYQLIPFAFRGNLLSLSAVDRQTPEAQVRAEIEAITDFFWSADANGLPLPEDSQALRIKMEALRTPRFLDDVKAGKIGWPPDAILSILALAQHYGLPTRLLDWTRSELAAAYFAAVGADGDLLSPSSAEDAAPSSLDGRSRGGWRSSNPSTAQHLAIWAFSQRAYRRDEERRTIPLGERPVKLITAPSAAIPNLRAQQGLFSVYRPKVSEDRRYLIDSRPLDTILEETLTETANASLPTLFHFTLPVNQARSLLWLLAQHGVSGASLFPGYDGVVKSLFERALWEAHPAPLHRPAGAAGDA